MVARIIFVALFAVWLVLVLMGKGGFIHLLVLCAAGTLAVDLATVYRTRLRAE